MSPVRQIRVAHLLPSVLLAGILMLLAAQRAPADIPAGFIESPSQTTMSPWASVNDVAIQASDCGSADSCVATGYYADASDDYSPLVVPVLNGIAGTGNVVSLPAGADTSGHQTSLDGVSCWDSGACVAVGDYSDSSGHSQALAVPISSGAPGAGVAVSLPGDSNDSPTSDLTSVSCGGPGSCLAAGSYLDDAGNTQALVVPISGGDSIGTGIEVTPAAGSAPNGSQDAELSDVACWSALSCVAVGSFSDANGDNQPLVVPITDGVPGTALAVPPPSDAATPGSSTVPDAVLAKVSCWSAGSCVAVGTYATAGNNVEGLVVPITDGLPAAAQAATLPEDALTADSTQDASLNDVSCTADGECVAVGDYLASLSPLDQEPLVEPIANGVAGAGEDVSLPGDAAGGIQDAELDSVSCPPTGSCAATGSYSNASGDQTELVDAVSEGTAAAGFEPPGLPNGSLTSPSVLSSVSCGPAGSCAAFGTYANTSQVEVPTLFSLQAPVAIGTPVLPSTRRGSDYQATLSAAGAWGSYSWSVISGNLPRGLTLNAQTGQISGTPTATGTSLFTVEATGTGVPVQAAEQRLRITVAAALRPHVSSSGGQLQVTGNRVALKLACAGSACRGSVRLQAMEAAMVTVRVRVVRGKGKHRRTTVHERRRVVYRRVAIGSANYSVAAGDESEVTVALNGTGRRLLAKARRGRLAVTLLVNADGGNRVVRGATIWTKVARGHTT